MKDEPLRIGILIGHGLDVPLPEAVEMATHAVQTLKQSGLNLDLWVDAASVTSLKRLAEEGCELLFYYGHGTEDGRLVFVDGHKSYEELSSRVGLESLWRELQGVMLFACHSREFAQALPCPWIAFSEEILRVAPKGFLYAWVKALKKTLKRAHDDSEKAMESNFADCLEVSAVQWPERHVEAGHVRLRRSSPGLAGRTEVDFASVVYEGRSYPEHDPFVGRYTDLQALWHFPEPASDGPLQRAVWVSGDGGMGKSALLRQYACNVRDLAFADDDDPVWLLQAYCLNCIQPRDLEQLLCHKAKDLYGWETAPETIDRLMKRLREVTGIHVWILDDLTYLRPEIGKEQDSLRAPRAIVETAHAAAIPLQLVASARFSGPVGWEPIQIGKLQDPEAVQLGRLIKQQAGFGTTAQDAIEVRHLFARCGGSTVHFKRALILAVRHFSTKPSRWAN